MAGGPGLTRGPELLSSEPRRSRTGAVLLIVVLLAGGVVGGERLLRERTIGRLLSAVEMSQIIIASAEARIAASVRYASPQIDSPGVPAVVRASLFTLVQATAGRELPALRRARTTLIGTDVLPWHDKGREARAAAVEHFGVRMAAVAAVSRSYDAFGLPQPGLLRSSQRARAALLLAAGTEDRGRVERAIPLP